MKLALAVNGDTISQHFGHCEGFMLVDIEENKVLNQELLRSPGHRPGALPKLLSSKGVNVVIAGGMGGTAQALFKEDNIDVITGVSGNSNTIIKDFLNGKLDRSAEICERHEFRGQGMGKGDCK